MGKTRYSPSPVFCPSDTQKYLMEKSVVKLWINIKTDKKAKPLHFAM